MKTIALATTLATIAAAIVLTGCATTTAGSDSYCTRFEDRIEKMDGKSVAVNRCVAWQISPSLGQRARFADEQRRLPAPAAAPASAPAPAGDKK